MGDDITDTVPDAVEEVVAVPDEVVTEIAEKVSEAGNITEERVREIVHEAIEAAKEVPTAVTEVPEEVIDTASAGGEQVVDSVTDLHTDEKPPKTYRGPMARKLFTKRG
jgi:hypothetical protein